ncbi:MAG: hypothetical protein OXB96_00905 [Candidatus Kaiserbacteria bacterium]|nr:hypothetical protein [Candidatus Kaiserbacteria bacterium]
MQEITCESLEHQYQVLQDTADEYRAILMSEGSDSEKSKELRTSFATETERLRENIVLYKKEKRGDIFYLSAEYHSGAAYIEALEEEGSGVDHSARILLNKLTSIPEERVRLERVTLEDLGLPDGGTTEEVFKAAEAQGLKPCPPWVGPQYCLTRDTKEWVSIGMEPFIDSNGGAYMFNVYKRRGQKTMSTVKPDFYSSDWSDGPGWLFVSDK